MMHWVFDPRIDSTLTFQLRRNSTTSFILNNNCDVIGDTDRLQSTTLYSSSYYCSCSVRVAHRGNNTGCYLRLDQPRTAWLVWWCASWRHRTSVVVCDVTTCKYDVTGMTRRHHSISNQSQRTATMHQRRRWLVGPSTAADMQRKAVRGDPRSEVTTSPPRCTSSSSLISSTRRNDSDAVPRTMPVRIAPRFSSSSNSFHRVLVHS